MLTRQRRRCNRRWAVRSLVMLGIPTMERDCYLRKVSLMSVRTSRWEPGFGKEESRRKGGTNGITTSRQGPNTTKLSNTELYFTVDTIRIRYTILYIPRLYYYTTTHTYHLHAHYHYTLYASNIQRIPTNHVTDMLYFPTTTSCQETSRFQTRIWIWTGWPVYLEPKSSDSTRWERTL